MFTERFDAEVSEAARRATSLHDQAVKLARHCLRSAGALDLHDLRRRAADLASRAAEAAEAASVLHAAVEAFSAMPAEPSAAADEESEWAAAFARACADQGLAVQGVHPDYHLFPFTIRVRLHEERVLFGRRSSYRLRPAALAEDVRRERDRIFGGGFQHERFGRSLVKAYEALAGEGGVAARRTVKLVDVYGLFALGNFGRGAYTRDQFAFDLYRFRLNPMVVEPWRIVLTDQRDAGGTAFEVPTGRGGTDRLGGLLLEPFGQAAGEAAAAAAGGRA